MTCGDTFLLYDDELESKPHLHVVITDPDSEGRVVLVSVTTQRAKSDTMTSLKPGDHEFIVHASVVTYAYSKVITVSKLTEMVANREAIPKEKATQRLVSRMQDGMLETDRAPIEVKQIFKESLSR